MPWIPEEECSVCGSTDIRLVPDEDRSVGYYGETWQCHNGHECGVLEGEAPALPPAEELEAAYQSAAAGNECAPVAPPRLKFGDTDAIARARKRR